VLQAEFESNRSHKLHLASQDELGAFIPGENCHENARRYVADHPGYEVVQGWIADYGIFTKHSVVRDQKTGDLVCVTFGPTDKYVGPFIIHRNSWTIGPFDALDNQVSPQISN
jgi:hypothetical protein